MVPPEKIAGHNRPREVLSGHGAAGDHNDGDRTARFNQEGQERGGEARQPKRRRHWGTRHQKRRRKGVFLVQVFTRKDGRTEK